MEKQKKWYHFKA